MTDHTDASDIVERLREAKSGAMFINNTGDRAWQRWMLNLLNDALDAAAEIERLRRELLDTLHNDERHVIERDEARAEIERLRDAARPVCEDCVRAYEGRCLRHAVGPTAPTSAKPSHEEVR